MVDSSKPSQPPDLSRGYAWILLAAWTAAFAASLVTTVYQEYRESQGLALERARIAFEKDVAYRRWMAEQGGVYVWVTERTQPSEYLQELPRRDVDTSWGQLTLINPARACRHVFDIEAKGTGTRSHITSLRPIRPANAPDPWERTALEACEGGAEEYAGLAEINGTSFFRLMQPLVTEQSCLQCHARQGYRVGDIRGGISVSVPMEPFQSLIRQHVVGRAIGHGVLWLLGLCGVGWGVRQLQRQATARRQFEAELRENEFRLAQLTERQARLDAEHALNVTNEKLQLARQIQQRILPRTAPALPGLDAAAILHSADATSGDFFDYLTLRDGNLGLVLADACGHGIGPALVAVETCAYLRALAGTSDDISEILRRLNGFLCSDMAEGFVTLFLARIDLATQTLVFLGAGHGGYLVHPDGSCTTLRSNNLPLGIQPNMEITCSEPQQIEPGDIFVLFTDGVAETINQVGEMFGAQRALALIQERRTESAKEIASALIQAVHEFAPDRPQVDDITALILKVKTVQD